MYLSLSLIPHFCMMAILCCVITRAQYAPGLCVCVRLCMYVYIYIYIYIYYIYYVSSKNTPVCVLPLEDLHENSLYSFFTEFIVL